MYSSPIGYTFPGHHGLNSRSCTTCSRRKIRCNKREPCSNCCKANVDCSFPPPGRAPRKPPKQTEGNLHERLRRLERVIQTLSNSRPAGERLKTTDPDTASADGMGKPGRSDIDDIANRFGSLIVTEDSSRYVSPGLWNHLNDEVTIRCNTCGPNIHPGGRSQRPFTPRIGRPGRSARCVEHVKRPGIHIRPQLVECQNISSTSSRRNGPIVLGNLQGNFRSRYQSAPRTDPRASDSGKRHPPAILVQTSGVLNVCNILRGHHQPSTRPVRASVWPEG
jgi:hypothetical protein